MINLALIGDGTWAQNYKKVVRAIPDCRIKYVKTRDYKELLRETDIDGIIIATPDDTHFEILNTFTNTPILVEKPLVTSMQQAYDLKSEKIMVGYTYLYNNALYEALKPIAGINLFIFELSNTAHKEGTNIIWYLASHQVALCLDLFGLPHKVEGIRIPEGIKIKLHYLKTTCILQVRDTAKQKVRKITAFGESEVEFDGLLYDNSTPTNSPLYKQVMAFLDFIKTGKTKADINFARNVTNILSVVEQMVA